MHHSEELFAGITERIGTLPFPNQTTGFGALFRERLLPNSTILMVCSTADYLTLQYYLRGKLHTFLPQPNHRFWGIVL